MSDFKINLPAEIATIGSNYDVCPAPAEKVQAPWRRYFARLLDITFYNVLCASGLALFANIGTPHITPRSTLLGTVVTILMMLFIEPALLALFGTTLGKWILGIRITDENGRKLTYGAGFYRIWLVIWSGYGLSIPIYSLVRLYKCYKSCEAGETLDWENYSVVILKDEKAIRNVLYIAAHIALYSFLFFALLFAQLPKHRGDISVAQFCENYNQILDYNGLGGDKHLSDKGRWIAQDNGFVPSYSQRIPDLVFAEENGIMRGVEFTQEFKDSKTSIFPRSNEMVILILAFAGAQKERKLSDDVLGEITYAISQAPYENYSFDVYGVHIACTTSAPNSANFSVNFSLTK